MPGNERADAVADLGDLSVLAHQLLNLMCTTTAVLEGIERGSLSRHGASDRRPVMAAREHAERVSLVLRDLARGGIAAAELVAFADPIQAYEVKVDAG